MPRHPQFLLRLGLFFILGTAIASALDDGIYYVPRVRIPDPAGKGYIFRDAIDLKEITDKGITLKKYSVDPFSVTIESQSNDNSDYKLWAHWNNTPRPGSLALVLDGNYIPFSYSSGSTTQFENSLNITDARLVDRAGTLFHVTPYSRQDPGHHYVCKFIPNPQGYTLSGPLPVTLQITNSGTTTICFSRSGGNEGEDGTMSDYLFGPYSFTAFVYPALTANEDDSVQPKPHQDDLAGDELVYVNAKADPASIYATLRPGESFTAQVDLAPYLNIKRVGTYEVRGTFHFQLVDPEFGKKDGKIIPWHILWDEYATAPFEAKITEAKSEKADQTDPKKQKN